MTARPRRYAPHRQLILPCLHPLLANDVDAVKTWYAAHCVYYPSSSRRLQREKKTGITTQPDLPRFVTFTGIREKTWHL